MSQRDFIYEEMIRPLLFKGDPEAVHYFIFALLKVFPWLVEQGQASYAAADLRLNLLGTQLAHPIGLAAGFDKNGLLVESLASLGFAFAEIGSITGSASNGNPKPRLFRLPKDEALINRLGLNGEGAEAVSARLKSSRRSLPVALNIAKTNDPILKGDAAIADVLKSFTAALEANPIYITYNASCPNTGEGIIGETKELNVLLLELGKLNTLNVPMLIKISPDSSESLLEGIVSVATSNNIVGFVCGNTTTTRDGLLTAADRVAAIGQGGLSGRPLKPLALQLCRRIFQLKKPEQVIIAAGGISSGADAYEFIRAGATALQLYTSLIYRGPSIVRQICIELVQQLKREGMSLTTAIGADYKT